MGLITEHRAECDRCGATNITSTAETPAGWRQAAAPTGAVRNILLCPKCVSGLAKFLERLPEDVAVPNA